MTATDPVARLADTARAALRAGGGDLRALSADEIRAVVAASAPAVSLVAGHAFQPGEIEAAARMLEALFVVEQGPSIRLSGEDSPPDWYFGDRRRPGRFASRYFQKLSEDGWAPASIDEVQESTADVLASVDDPQREGPWDWRGLVVGNVQSGKTAHYAGVIARAADAGYRVIVVLAGMHNILRRQTQLRLDADFLGYDTAPVRGSTAGARRRIGVGLIDADDLLVDSLTTADLSGDFTKGVAQNANISLADRPFVFVVKKRGSVLRNLNGWISRLPNLARQAPLLVIDDEADQASPDTGEQGFLPDGTFDEDYDPKVINGEIRRLLKAFDRSAYVGYTATPFANIFIHDERAAEDYGPDLFPSAFMLSISAPDDYFGPLAVFGRDDDADSEALPVIRHLDQGLEDWIQESHDRTLVPLYCGEDRVPPSLALAMRSFVLTCAARQVRGHVAAHNSMLVHVSRFQDVHDRVYAQVEAELKALKDALDASDPVELATLETLWRDDFQPTIGRMASGVFGRNCAPVAWDAVLARLSDAAGRIQPVVANGRSKTGLDYEAAKAEGLNVIVIGGDKLSRGLTLEGLSTSYFLRVAKQYDSLLQMGRWFGYRRGYADLCRLYTTSDMEDWFRHLATVNEDLREQLAHMRLTGSSPKKYGLRIATHSVMQVTAANKRRHAAERTVSYSGEGKIQTVLRRNRASLETNAELVVATLSALSAPERDPSTPDGKTSRGWLWRSVPGRTVAGFLRAFVFPQGARDVDGVQMADYVTERLQADELTNWTIFLPSGSGRPFSVAGLDVRGVRRAPTNRSSSDLLVFKSILSPPDEAIDLSADQHARALAATNDILRLKEEDETDRPSGPRIRAVRDPRNGLLLIYPVEVDAEHKEPVYGLVVSFPESPTATGRRELENTVRQREAG